MKAKPCKNNIVKEIFCAIGCVSTLLVIVGLFVWSVMTYDQWTKNHNMLNKGQQNYYGETYIKSYIDLNTNVNDLNDKVSTLYNHVKYLKEDIEELKKKK